MYPGLFQANQMYLLYCTIYWLQNNTYCNILIGQYNNSNTFNAIIDSDPIAKELKSEKAVKYFNFFVKSGINHLALGAFTGQDVPKIPINSFYFSKISPVFTGLCKYSLLFQIFRD